jgi:DNA polymerase III delta subunit
VKLIVIVPCCTFLVMGCRHAPAYTGTNRGSAPHHPWSIRALRSIEEGGDEALMVLGGIAARLRDLIRVRSVPEQVPLSQVAKAAGLRFDWQARRYRQQAGNFSLEELVAIHLQVTEADKALKSGATGDVVMPALVAAIAA